MRTIDQIYSTWRNYPNYKHCWDIDWPDLVHQIDFKIFSFQSQYIYLFLCTILYCLVLSFISWFMECCEPPMSSCPSYLANLFNFFNLSLYFILNSVLISAFSIIKINKYNFNNNHLTVTYKTNILIQKTWFIMSGNNCFIK